MDFGAVSHVGGASSEAGPDRPTVRGTGRGSYIGPAAVTERKKLISSGFLLRSTLYGPRPGYGAIGLMRGGTLQVGGGVPSMLFVTYLFIFVRALVFERSYHLVK